MFTLFYVYQYFTFTYVCTTCVPGTCGVQKRASDALALLLQTAMGCRVGAGNGTRLLWKSSGPLSIPMAILFKLLLLLFLITCVCVLRGYVHVSAGACRGRSTQSWSFYFFLLSLPPFPLLSSSS